MGEDAASPATANAATLASYEARAQAYVDGTAHTLDPATRQWIELSLQGLERNARILEIGSAFGRDAAYITALGYRVVCSDAAESFLQRLTAAGLGARRLNILTGEIEGVYDLILANAVFLHFSRNEFALAVAKAFAALDAGGRLALSLKAGDGEAWSSEKLGAPRYFCYWRTEALTQALRRIGFEVVSLVEATADRAHSDWIYAIARKPAAR